MNLIKDIDISDVGLVILNYMTVKETAEMLASVEKYYPNLKIVVVDNGSSKDVINKLENIVKNYSNVSLLCLNENLGFARGNNAGIRELRKLGYEYIISSNNDILFTQSGIVESLKYYCIEGGAAVVGPRIVNLNNEDQNPCRVNRFSEKEARSYYRRACWIPDFAFTGLRIWRYVRHYLGHNASNNLQRPIPRNACQVYALHGSFIMFGPRFSEHYQGFDSNTFFYCEENVLGEMLLAKDLKAVFVPETKVIHKEDKTVNFVWGANLSKQMFKFKKRSVRYWFKHHYMNK